MDSYLPQDFVLQEGSEARQVGDAVYYRLHSPKFPGRPLALKVIATDKYVFTYIISGKIFGMTRTAFASELSRWRPMSKCRWSVCFGVYAAPSYLMPHKKSQAI